MSRISGKITEKPVKIRQKLNRRPLPYQEKMCYYLNHKNVDCRATPVSTKEESKCFPDNIGSDAGGSPDHSPDHDVTQLAKEYGTPLYLMDEAADPEPTAGCICRRSVTISAPALCHCTPARRRPSSRCTASWRRRAWAWTWCPPGNCTPLSARASRRSGSTSTATARPMRIIAYGVHQGIGFFVADNREELLALEKTAAEADVTQKILLRVTPGIDPHTYEAVSTGKVDSQIRCGGGDRTGHGTGEAGSDAAPSGPAGAALPCRLAGVRRGCVPADAGYHGAVPGVTSGTRPALTLSDLNLGGGYGVRYTDEDEAIDIPARLAELAASSEGGNGTVGPAHAPVPDGTGPQHCGGCGDDAVHRWLCRSAFPAISSTRRWTAA